MKAIQNCLQKILYSDKIDIAIHKKEKPLEMYVSNSFSNFINSDSSNSCVLQTILYYYFSKLLSCLDD